jgi:hypothetical protein
MLKAEERIVSLPLSGLVGPNVHARTQLRVAACALITLLYAAAFVLPAYAFSSPMMGYEAFLSGLFFAAGTGLLSWISFVLSSGWVANPLFAVGIVCLLRGRTVAASALGVAALLFAIKAGLFAYSSEVPLLLGYYVWLLSIAALAAASILFWRLHRG